VPPRTTWWVIWRWDSGLPCVPHGPEDPRTTNHSVLQGTGAVDTTRLRLGDDSTGEIRQALPPNRVERSALRKALNQTRRLKSPPFGFTFSHIHVSRGFSSKEVLR